ncbi:hypothetical protein NEHOM01_0085 [Nematocida homosporus]|uniref:uncharacterized protein n=1 Tax=Nematocida homosporus TaxID=1912981 RepID=UPI00221E9757|nr:uncharacterized protein NEHOM01_0085 [Nematocida homosporus]KAI5184340.1 hypothetical protein NEHOM01_0085 [Nematocida homosporus]
MTSSNWSVGKTAEPIKENLMQLASKDYRQFCLMACKVKFPHLKRQTGKFRFSDVHSYNYHEIKDRYNLTDEVNASLIDGSPEFIAMEYPTDHSLVSTAELVLKSKTSVIISLIGIRYHWESDFMREHHVLDQKMGLLEFLAWAQEQGFDTSQLSYSDLHTVFTEEDGNFVIEKYHEKDTPSQLVFRINCNTWKDKTPPTENTLKVLDAVHTMGRTLTNTASPTIVHCMAGIGRTGSFIFYAIFRQALLNHQIADESRMSAFIDLFLYLRSKRTWMIEAPSQLELLYRMFIVDHS